MDTAWPRPRLLVSRQRTSPRSRGGRSKLDAQPVCHRYPTYMHAYVCPECHQGTCSQSKCISHQPRSIIALRTTRIFPVHAPSQSSIRVQCPMCTCARPDERSRSPTRMYTHDPHPDTMHICTDGPWAVAGEWHNITFSPVQSLAIQSRLRVRPV